MLRIESTASHSVGVFKIETASPCLSKRIYLDSTPEYINTPEYIFYSFRVVKSESASKVSLNACQISIQAVFNHESRLVVGCSVCWTTSR